jgi:chromosomal replication initiation ATPase DnaA
MPTQRLQLPLPFPHAPGYDARDFLAAASNQEALAWLDTDWPERRLALWGPAGCGKSHLLHIWAEKTGARLLTGQALTEQTPRDLGDLPELKALALDDAHTVASEALLLHVLNTARDRALHIVLAAATPPSRWPVQLPDLVSRLRAITAVEIGPPSDDLLAALLVRLLSDRQLSVAQSVQDWLLMRLPRSAEALRHAVALLDQVSLASGRAITRSFAAGILFGGRAGPYATGAVAAAGAIEDGAPHIQRTGGEQALNEEVSMSGVDASSQPAGFL